MRAPPHQARRQDPAKCDPSPRPASARWMATVAILPLAVMLTANMLRPLPIDAHYEGLLIATADRLRSGGPIYPSPESTYVDATPSHFPGNVFVVRAASLLFPQALELIPRALAIFSSLLFLVILVGYTRSLGVPSLLAAAYAVFCFTLTLAASNLYQITNFVPDYLLCALGLLCCSLVRRFEQARAGWRTLVLLGSLLAAVGLLKQSGLAMYLGLGAYAVLLSGRPVRQRILLVAVLAAAGAVVLGVLLSIPGCFATTVLGMAAHRYRIASFLKAEPYYVLTRFWPVFIPALLYVARLGQSGLRKGPPGVKILLCFWVPFALIQTAAALKIGGGSYDFDLVFFLLIPVAALELAAIIPVRRKTQLAALLLLTAVLIQARQTARYVHAAKAERPRFREAVQYLETNFRGRPALYAADLYRLVRRAGLLPVSELAAICHHTMGGRTPPRVEQAVREQRYAVILGLAGWTTAERGAGTWNQFYYLVQTHYEPLDAPGLPPSLRGQVLVPRIVPAKTGTGSAAQASPRRGACPRFRPGKKTAEQSQRATHGP